jgi:SAM-dependent methyltransferase
VVVERSRRCCLLCGTEFVGRAFLCRACARRYRCEYPSATLRQRFYEAVDRTYPDWANTYGAYNLPEGLLRVLASQPRHSAVLDLGAGGGFLLQALQQLGFHTLIGLDLARTALGSLRERVPESHAVCGDAECLPFAAGSLDIVVSSDLVEHLSRPERHFREVARVLRPGGLYLFKTPNRLLAVPYYRLAGLYDYPFWHPSLFSPGALRACLTSNGFTCRFVAQPGLTPAQLRKIPIRRLRPLARRLPLGLLPPWLRPHLEVVAERQ